MFCRFIYSDIEITFTISPKITFPETRIKFTYLSHYAIQKAYLLFCPILGKIVKILKIACGITVAFGNIFCNT